VAAVRTASDLASLSRRLGDPALDFVVLGEGNTSARVDGKRFVVKASGASMACATADDFVAMDSAQVLCALDEADSDAAWRAALAEACPDRSRRPSIEVAVHAVSIGVCGADWVAHTHPTAVNSILCSRTPKLLAEPLFPDQVVVCGSAYAFVPYVDPGRQLGVAARVAVVEHRAKHGEWPRVLLLENHGMVALGQSADDAFNITLMMTKAARIVLGAKAAGGVRPLAQSDVDRLAAREDEAHRASILRGGGPLSARSLAPG
jgi:rhamnose utilization protein RhaD (predicted bifunctional aldolase and dehydrogenase)